PARLVGVELGGPAGVDLAEVAPPGALVTADEEGRLPVLPAFVDVGAAGLLADRVQALALDQLGELLVLRAPLELGLDPPRLALDGCRAVPYSDPQELPPLRGHRSHSFTFEFGAVTLTFGRGYPAPLRALLFPPPSSIQPTSRSTWTRPRRRTPCSWAP